MERTMRGTEENARWRENLRAMRERVRSRFRVAQAHTSLRQSQRTGMVGGAALRGKTGIVVARVFKGNVVLTRIAKNVAKKQWMLRKKLVLDYIPKLRNAVAGVTGGAFMYGGSVQAEALAQEQSHQTFLEELAAKRKLLRGRGARTLDDDLTKKISEDSPTIRVLRAVAVPVLGNICHVFMHGLNRTEVYGLEKLQKAILHRTHGQGLVTVSNHVAAMDDPLVTASLLSPHILLHERMLRWTLCATDRCFTSVSKSIFFSSLKVLPVSRGQGIYQQGMDLALEKLDRGDWVHIFPEGSRSRDGGKTLGSAKRGVGRLISDAKDTPVIVPFIHDGMQEVLPIGSKFPHICKKVTVLVGDPIPVDDLVSRCSSGEIPVDAVYDAIAERIGERMQSLKTELDQMVRDQKLEQEKNQKLYLARRGSGIWEHVDWEMQGFSVEEMTREFAESCKDRTSTLQEIDRGEVVHNQFFAAAESWDCESDELRSSITTRLKAYADPTALFMSFAAKGLAFYETAKAMHV